MSQITKEQLFKYLDEEKRGKIKKEEMPQVYSFYLKLVGKILLKEKLLL